jgi:hypothetical protein
VITLCWREHRISSLRWESYPLRHAVQRAIQEKRFRYYLSYQIEGANERVDDQFRPFAAGVLDFFVSNPVVAVEEIGSLTKQRRLLKKGNTVIKEKLKALNEKQAKRDRQKDPPADPLDH